MTDQMRELVKLLAGVDSLFIPIRRYDESRFALAVYQFRTLYRSQGVLLGATAGDDSQRRAIVRMRDGMVTDGMIKKIIRRGDRATAAKFTPKGEAYARAIVGLPMMPDSMKILAKLSTPWGRIVDRDGCAFMQENALAGIGNDGNPEDQKRLVELEETMLPALVAGFALSGSDLHGRVWYGCTPAGHKAIREGFKGEDGNTDLFGDCRELYYDELRSRWSALDSIGLPDPRDIGPVPFSVTGYDRMIPSENKVTAGTPAKV